jgi:hypothetical protein
MDRRLLVPSFNPIDDPDSAHPLATDLEDGESTPPSAVTLFDRYAAAAISGYATKTGEDGEHLSARDIARWSAKDAIAMLEERARLFGVDA